jgi:iron complex outermembrane recepter protein
MSPEGQVAEPAAAPQTAPAPGVAAESADAADVASGDIVVTAQKRSERLQDVPLAVSVVGGEALANTGAPGLEGATALVPALHILKSGTTLNQSLFLRGVGTTTFSIAGEPSVSAWSTVSYWRAPAKRSAISWMWSGWKCCAVRRARCSARTRRPA